MRHLPKIDRPASGEAAIRGPLDDEPITGGS